MQFDRLKRREFITLLGGAAVPELWPRSVGAQQRDRVRRVGVLMGLAADDPEAQARLAAFAQGLQQSGWTIGQNVRVDYRWGGGNADNMRKYAAELVALAPDVILAHSSAAVAPLLQATRTIPIVFTHCRRPRRRRLRRTAWHARAATPRALPTSNMPWAGNGWSCSKRSRPV